MPNLAEYDAALSRRDSLTVGFTKEAVTPPRAESEPDETVVPPHSKESAMPKIKHADALAMPAEGVSSPTSARMRFYPGAQRS
ncbi:MAG: hypothetical protein QOF70_1100 [Acetobacteraceae bacterium]|jgi:hypothetical protein|nr:hypothetical protein [Acetobacteraceae bacterium]